jgi:hypothetical protein
MVKKNPFYKSCWSMEWLYISYFKLPSSSTPYLLVWCMLPEAVHPCWWHFFDLLDQNAESGIVLGSSAPVEFCISWSSVDVVGRHPFIWDWISSPFTLSFAFVLQFCRCPLSTVPLLQFCAWCYFKTLTYYFRGIFPLYFCITDKISLCIKWLHFIHDLIFWQ